jgi:hypothetical protein
MAKANDTCQRFGSTPENACGIFGSFEMEVGTYHTPELLLPELEPKSLSEQQAPSRTCMEHSWFCGTAVVVLLADRTGHVYFGFLVKALPMTLRAVCFTCDLVALLKMEKVFPTILLTN